MRVTQHYQNIHSRTTPNNSEGHGNTTFLVLSKVETPMYWYCWLFFCVSVSSPEYKKHNY